MVYIRFVIMWLSLRNGCVHVNDQRAWCKSTGPPTHATWRKSLEPWLRQYSSSDTLFCSLFLTYGRFLCKNNVLFYQYFLIFTIFFVHMQHWSWWTQMGVLRCIENVHRNKYLGLHFEQFTSTHPSFFFPVVPHGHVIIT